MEIDIKGNSLTFQLYECSGNSVVSFVKDASEDESQFSYTEKRNGFFEIMVDDKGAKFCFTEFGAIVPFEVERLSEEGKAISETFFRMDTCGILLFEDCLLMSGKPAAQRHAAEALSAMLMKEIEAEKFDQSVMRRFENNFITIKGIQLDEIPHHEIKKVRLSGNMEDVYTLGGLDVANAKIKSITGVYKFSDKEFNMVKAVDTGKITVSKKKGRGIKIDQVRQLVDFISPKIS
jgi:putative sterol carrier protein